MVLEPHPANLTMKDLTNSKAIYIKGGLFLIVGLLAVFLLLLENPSWKTATLLVLAIWCFARLYYFMFYVIEHYVDSKYKFSGVMSFLAYLKNSRKK